MSHFLICHETGASLVNNVLERLDLSNKSVCFHLILHSFVEIFIECLSHLVESWCINISRLSSLHESGQASSAGGSNTIISLVAGLGHQELADLLDMIVADLRHFIDEDGEHLQSHIFLFDLIGHNLHGLFAIGTSLGSNLLKHICKLGKVLLPLDSHLRVQSCHREH